jgi:hypothetical protein
MSDAKALITRLATMARWQRDNMTKSGVYNNFTNGSLAEEAANFIRSHGALDAMQEACNLTAILDYMENTNARQFDPRHVVTLIALVRDRLRAPVGNSQDGGQR